MNVNISPYYRLNQYGFAVLEDASLEYLPPTAEEEFVRINPVGNGAANEWHPVEDNWGFIAVFEKQLAKHVEDDDNNKEREKASGDDHTRGIIRQEITQRLGDHRKDTHDRK